MRVTRLLAIPLMFIVGFGTAQETTTYVAHNLERFPGPQVYKYQHSGATLYVETDGRHVAAISGDGKLLWVRDPFKDGRLDSYRTEKPQIVYIGPVSKFRSKSLGGESDDFAAVTFNSSQFGLLRISNGEFQFLGQD
jgi:hypothetical protein